MSYSMIIYLAGVLDNLNSIYILAVVFAIIIPTITFFVAIERSSYNSSKDSNSYFSETWAKVKKYFNICIFILIASILLPSSKTVYLIAASSMAEKMVKSEDFRKLYEKSFELLNSKIEQSLDLDKKK